MIRASLPKLSPAGYNVVDSRRSGESRPFGTGCQLRPGRGFDRSEGAHVPCPGPAVVDRPGSCRSTVRPGRAQHVKRGSTAVRLAIGTRTSGSSHIRVAGFPAVPTAQEYRGEAHLPAEQPEAAQEARVPAAHAHPRRSVDPQCPSWQGSQPARRLTEIGRSCCPPPCACVRRPSSPTPSRTVPAALPAHWSCTSAGLLPPLGHRHQRTSASW